MSLKSIIENLLKKTKQPQSDHIVVKLEDLYIEMTRITDQETPHEVTVVVPRAEIREKYSETGNLIEKEVILNSITVVHAPRHPLAGPLTPIEPPDIPARSKKYLTFHPK